VFHGLVRLDFSGALSRRSIPCLANLACLDSLLSLTPITLSGLLGTKILTHTQRGTHDWLLGPAPSWASLWQSRSRLSPHNLLSSPNRSSLILHPNPNPNPPAIKHPSATHPAIANTLSHPPRVVWLDQRNDDEGIFGFRQGQLSDLEVCVSRDPRPWFFSGTGLAFANGNCYFADIS
jgi:hypothetical protein